MKKALLFLFCTIAAAVLLGYFVLPRGYEIRNSHPGGTHIICFGDSLTYGIGAADGNDYPSHLSRLIGEEVINEGVPGDTTEDALERLDRDVLVRSPKIVILTLGGNDLKNKVPREVAFENLRTLVLRIQDTGALVVIGGIDIPLFGKGFADAYEELARETGSVLVPNIYAGILGRGNLMSDLIHPNDDGYRVMAELFYQAIRPYL
ncbi:MAG: GDSL-type esterase/lipase family protein [Desulfomonilia bacterium]